MQLSTHVVTLGTRSTNSSLSSSRAASAGETGSTSNTSSTLWGWRVWVWEHWMCRIQEEQTWSMRMTLTGEPLAPAEPSDPGAPCGQKDGNKTLTLIRSHSAFFYFSINLQANRKVQYLLTAGPAGPAGPGLPGSPRAPWGPSPPRAPWGPVSPCGGKQQSLRNLRLQYNKCLKETNHMCLNKEFRQRQSVRWRIRRATTQLAAFSFLLHSALNKSRCVCDFYNWSCSDGNRGGIRGVLMPSGGYTVHLACTLSGQISLQQTSLRAEDAECETRLLALGGFPTDDVNPTSALFLQTVSY